MDRDEYTETNDVFLFDRKGAIKLTHNGTPILEKAVYKKGRTEIAWLREHNLGPFSHPVEWLVAMLSRKQHSYERRKDKQKEWVSIIMIG